MKNTTKIKKGLSFLKPSIRYLLLWMCLLCGTNAVQAWSFSSGKHITNYELDLQNQEFSFTMLIYRVTNHGDEYLKHTTFSLGGNSIIKLGLDDNVSGGSQFTISGGDDEVVYEFLALGKLDNNDISVTSRVEDNFTYADVVCKLPEAYLYDDSYAVVLESLYFKDDGDHTAITNRKLTTLEGWPTPSLKNVSASTDLCGQVDFSWDIGAGRTEDLSWEISNSAGKKIASGDGNSTTNSYILSDPKPVHENYILKLGYAEDLVKSTSKTVVGGPPITGYDLPTNVTVSKHSCDEIVITWNEGSNIDNLKFYNIYCNDREMVQVSAGETSYTFASDIQSKDYTIKIKSESNCGFVTSNAKTVISELAELSAPKLNPVSGSQSSNTITWSSATNHTGYYLIRTSGDGSSTRFDDIDVSETSYTDSNVSGCVTYTYELFAYNNCEPEGISDGLKQTRKIRPQIDNYLTYFDASKAYFTNKVMLEWEVEEDNYSLVNEFEIQRCIAGSDQWNTIASVQSTSTYDDESAIGGIIYEYRIVGKLTCENNTEKSNILEALGFRIPYGIVTGELKYESDGAVKGAEVLAEKGSAPIGTSLYFGGDAQVQVHDNDKLTPENSLIVEAWIRPDFDCPNASIINKSGLFNGYKLSVEGNDVVFEIYVTGTPYTVRAKDILTGGDYTHVAGVFNESGIKILINGEVPNNVVYQLTTEDLQKLEEIGISTEILQLIGGVENIEYNSFEELNTELELALNPTVAQSVIPVIAPIAQKVSYKEEAVKLGVSGFVSHSNTDLIIGEGFKGNIDEIRIWNKNKTEEEINYDYKRLVSNDAEGIAAYWRCDENFGTEIYDASKSNGLFHKNDGAFSNVTWSPTIPNKNLLGWMGKADENGFYIIPYIPYLGTGENFTLTPRYEQHEFDPRQKTVFLGEGSAILDEQNFTDISSFKVTGTVFYEGTYCGVEGAIVGVDGTPLLKNGNFIYTDENGEFTIEVPVGEHYVYVEKSGHNFQSYKFPPGPVEYKYNFQEDITGINFIDQTTQKIAGRVVGGTIEGDKLPAIGLSKNNIGVADFEFVPVKGNTINPYLVTTDAKTGEYVIELPPMKYNVRDFEVKKNPAVQLFFTELEVADFSEVIEETEVEYEFPNKSMANISLLRSEGKASIYCLEERKTYEVAMTIISNGTGTDRGRFEFGGELYEYILEEGEETKVTSEVLISPTIIKGSYNYVYNFIYRTAPKVSVYGLKDEVESNYFGDDEIRYQDPASGKMKSFDITNTPFQFPVFTQGVDYQMVVKLEEVYLNQDLCEGLNGGEGAIEDRVAVNDGVLEIYNQFGAVETPENIGIEDGKAIYNFKGGYPILTQDANFPWRDFSGVLNITVVLDGTGYAWEPYETTSAEKMPYQYDDENFPHPDDKYFRGYLMGNRQVKGSDFVTQGPELVDHILRDPPGSESYAFIEKGTSITTSSTTSISNGTTVSDDLTISLGNESMIVPPTGGAVIESGTVNDISGGVTIGGTSNTEYGYESTRTFTTTFSTSEAPDLSGAPSDLFIGSSQNYNISLADKLTIFPTDHIEDLELTTGGNSAGHGTKFALCLQRILCSDLAGYATTFVYSADHIENYLIPQLENLRNNLFVSDEHYTSNISADHELFGTNNDDPKWNLQNETPSTRTPYVTELEDLDGASYTYDSGKTDEELLDSQESGETIDYVRNYNEQIRLWQEALEQNEREKYEATLLENISFNAGNTIESSASSEMVEFSSSTFELEVNRRLLWEKGFEINGAGSVNSLSIETTYNKGNVRGETETESTTFGYVLSDPDIGDYYSIDIKDSKQGNGPVFSVKAGRSMCPYVNAVYPKYFQPGTYRITDKVVDKLRNAGVSEDLLKILQWEERNTLPLSQIGADYFDLTSGLRNELMDVQLSMIQVFDRKFKSSSELTSAVGAHINLTLPSSYDSKLSELSGEYEEAENHIASNNQGQKFYLFSNTKRGELWDEFNLYLSIIIDLTRETDENSNDVLPLSEATIRRERPTASMSPNVRYDIPDDNKAYFTITFGNESDTGEGMSYEAAILDDTNPDGAIIKIDGGNVNRSFDVDANGSINKTVSVEMGRDDVYHYEDLQIIFFASCEVEYADNGAELDPAAVDTVTFSAHFVPSCTNIDINTPNDQFVINANDEVLVDGAKQTNVPILMSGYDLNNEIFEKLEFQYKTSTEAEWTTTTPYFLDPEEGEDEIPGSFTATEWDLSGYPDGEYMMRAKTGCKAMPDGTQVFDLSEVWTGVVDRKAPQVFGSPQPADGILSPDDDIVIKFNETIYGQKLTKLENLDIRGILNGTEIRHDVSVKFSDDESQFIRIPSGVNVADKSFTVEFWMKPARAMADECLFSQSTDSENALHVALNRSGNLQIQIGSETVIFDGYSVLNNLEKWNHYAFVYDNVRHEVTLMIDGIPEPTKTIYTNYTGFGDIYLGKSMIGNSNPLLGNIHELRIWESARTASKLFSNMLITLSGKETSLLGYWPLDDADGTIASDKVHKRNATVTGMWEIYPKGYAATFTGKDGGFINTPFSDVAFTEEQDFTVEMWFKGIGGQNQCLLSNGFGDSNDITLYYISLEALDEIERAMPLEEEVANKLTPMINQIFADEQEFINEIGTYLTIDKAEYYREQLLRFAKLLPTYWSINTDSQGYIQVNNNGKRIKSNQNYFDNTWHHLALVVERVGNTRLYVDGEAQISEPSSSWSGFGGARLFIGSRGRYDANEAGFIFDQHYTGVMDEVRIWSTVLQQTQIERNRKMRLDGDEMGLVAYWPFETYEEVMGVPILDGIYDDVITERESSHNATMFTQNTEVPNVRMTRPSSKVDFDFVYTNDQIAFVINDPVAKIENCILDITVQNVQDMYGNKMNSPATWSAYIDMNQVVWDQQSINIEKELYEALTFESTIVNSSGQQQNFSIENLPGWLTAEPMSGTIAPMTEQTVLFTINEAVNVGSYSQNIHLQTDFDYDEKLMVNLRVEDPLPADWQIDPTQYSNSMSVIAQIKVNDVISIDEYDKVAAFVDGECRGMASLIYIAEYDMYEVFLDVYSNKINNEYFELHIWDASEGREYREVVADGLPESTQVAYEGKYEFINNNVYGSPSEPIIFEANGLIVAKIAMNKGWNWCSFNLELSRSNTLSNTLGSIEAENGDLVKGLIDFSTYSSYWAGTLTEFHPEQLYMFYLNSADTLIVSGMSVDPEQTPINIVDGWNWIGYTPLTNMEINEALGRFTPSHGDLIKSQYEFSMYDELMGWVGTLQYLKPYEGYKYKYEPSIDEPKTQELTYPEQGMLLKNAQVADVIVGKNIFGTYEFNMPVVAVVEVPNSLDKNGTLAAYSEGELRGQTQALELGAEDNLFFLTAFSNANGDNIAFEFTSSDGTSYKVNESIAFAQNENQGTIDNPLRLTVTIDDQINPVEEETVHVYPNPIDQQVFVESNIAGKKKITITNTTGVLVHEAVYNSERNEAIGINLGNIPSGVYFVTYTNGSNVIVNTIIKK